MGQSKPPTAVKLIVGMLSGQEVLFDMAQEKMTEWWGGIDIQSEVMDFACTHYYEEQMGAALKRKFVSFGRLIDPGELAEIKHQSNDLEEQIAASETGKALGVERPINLDPGYIEPSKLVLATTKNYSHRVYIGRGMYAEATLHYHKGSWQGWPYTYPDYAGGEYSGFFNRVRQKLMEQLSSPKENT